MKALFEPFRRFDARRIFGFIRRLGGMSRPKVKCYDLRSTHALRVEGDDKDTETHTSTHTFLSTPSGWRTTYFRIRSRSSTEFLSALSGWRATSAVFCTLLDMPISIHALRVEGDSFPPNMVCRFWNFYPRPPSGGRPADAGAAAGARGFLSTPSEWRATIFHGFLQCQY